MVSSVQSAILVCQLLEELAIVKSEEVTITRSQLTCMSEATARFFELIMICFSTRNISDRSGIIELCTCLKNHPLTKKTPLFASMDHLHRDITLQMQNAGLDFVEIRRPKEHIDPGYIFNLVRNGGVSIRTDRILAQLCPFLNYTPIDIRSELITCRAYQNHMVLGGRRLREVCEADSHLHCEYFLNPRLKS
ncbi:MAG: hypothetical protein H8D96_20985 [Desulfobacterales bacterium]|uniref:Uncharacterized protein n=1 Tax=Candidatus Desulfatibia vada TaxID=2841696 RepID=A0A8J6TPB7_9BACT|nr:hypothetical protein [Candidatus Desulfatibia vada]